MKRNYSVLLRYRDKDQVEVDLVIEDGEKIWGVEVKKAASIQSKDGEGLAKLASLSGNNWQGGILLYTGNNCLPISQVPNTYAVLMNALWGSRLTWTLFIRIVNWFDLFIPFWIS